MTINRFLILFFMTSQEKKEEGEESDEEEGICDISCSKFIFVTFSAIIMCDSCGKS